MVKHTMAINVMSFFAPDLASPLPPFCFSLPILVGCFPFSPFHMVFLVGDLLKTLPNEQHKQGRRLTARTSTNTHTCTCRNRTVFASVISWVMKMSNWVGDNIWKIISPPTLIEGFLPIKFNSYYYFCTKSQGYTKILVQSLFCSFLVLWALPLKLE